MRQIKYRVWAASEQIFFYIDSNNPLIFSVLGIGEDNNFYFCKTKDILDDFTPRKFLSVNLESCIFQQFTGLKDSNGRDIFEGDIITLSPTNFKETLIKDNIYEVDVTKPLPSLDIIYAKGVIEWNATMCQFDIRYVEVCEDWASSGATSIGLVEYNYRYEVVGHILDNQELL